MNESTTISRYVSTTSGDEGFEEPPADRKDESTRSTTGTSDRTTQSSTRTESSDSSIKTTDTKKPTRSVQTKRRSKKEQEQEAVIIPRRRKGRQMPARTSNRAPNDVIFAVELASEFHKPGSRGSRTNTPNTKDRVLANQTSNEIESPETIELKSNVMNGITANRDRLFGGEPEPKPRKTVRRKRRPKPDDNSTKNVYWWVGTSEDDEPPTAQNRSATASGTQTGIHQILGGESPPESSKNLPFGNRRMSYKLRDDDTSAKLFGAPEVKRQLTKIRPGDASYNRLFGSECEGLPLSPRTNTTSGQPRQATEVTRERLFGENSCTSPRPIAKHFPDKSAHENIFAPSSSNHGAKKSPKAATVRNPIVGEAAQPSRTRRDSGIPSSNPITGEGYRPAKRDIHAVTCRI